MIEVEKKFTLSDENKARIIQGAKFLGEKTFTDTYYDTPDFNLTTNDKWLRLRNDRFKLKLTMNEGNGSNQRKLDQYEELDDEGEIKKALGISSQSGLKECLATKGYVPFSTFTTTRRKYKKGDFIIDLDVMDFGYSVGELELMVQETSEMENALSRILEFAQEQGLSIAPVRGKVIEFIKRNNPKHYQALVDVGIL